MSPKDYQDMRDRFIELAKQGGDFASTRELWDLLAVDDGGTWQERRDAVNLLASTEQKVAPQNLGPRLVGDYKALLAYRSPGDKLADAANTLATLQQALQSKEGWAAARETYVYLQRGTAQNAFCGRTPKQALTDLLAAYLLTSDLKHARAALLSPADSTRGPEQVQQGDDGSLVIGDVKVS
ncbi:MAG: hypothetical protein ACYCW6_23645 [Candidatus Xenobia bacterium]